MQEQLRARMFSTCTQQGESSTSLFMCPFFNQEYIIEEEKRVLNARIAYVECRYVESHVLGM